MSWHTALTSTAYLSWVAMRIQGQKDMGHGQYLVFSSKSSIFEECIIVFQVLVYKQMLSFLKSVLSFSKPQLNSKK